MKKLFLDIKSIDGYAIVKDPDSGFFCYGNLTEDWEDLVNAANLQLSKGLRITREFARQKAFAAFQYIGAKRRCEVRRKRMRNLLRRIMMSRVPSIASPRRETKGDFVGLWLLRY